MTNKFWKIIFNIWGILIVLMIINDLMKDTINLFSLSLLGLGSTGLYGLAFDKTIASQRFWRIYFIGLAALSSILIPLGVISAFLTLNNPETAANLGEIGIGRLIFIGFYFTMYGFLLRGLFLYAFKRDALWPST